MVYKDGRFWPSLSFELQLAFAHVLRQCSILLSRVLNSILKPDSKTGILILIFISIANLNQDGKKPTTASSIHSTFRIIK